MPFWSEDRRVISPIERNQKQLIPRSLRDCCFSQILRYDFMLVWNGRAAGTSTHLGFVGELQGEARS